MNFQPLSLHKTRFQPGKPTPYGIFDADGRLLLARGHQFDSAEQLEKLIEREATIDLREFDDPARKIANARRDQLPAYWEDSMGEVGRLLRASPTSDFTTWPPLKNSSVGSDNTRYARDVTGFSSELIL